MVPYQIEWTNLAKLDLFTILEYYNQRNKSKVYSKKLYTKITKSIIQISKNPKIGIQTDYDSVRSYISGDYQIIYEVFNQLILIIMIWDCRRNPEDKKIQNYL
jgi:plasmid stabilization system protein ParE